MASSMRAIATPHGAVMSHNSDANRADDIDKMVSIGHSTSKRIGQRQLPITDNESHQSPAANAEPGDEVIADESGSRTVTESDYTNVQPTS